MIICILAKFSADLPIRIGFPTLGIIFARGHSGSRHTSEKQYSPKPSCYANHIADAEEGKPSAEQVERMMDDWAFMKHEIPRLG